MAAQRSRSRQRRPKARLRLLAAVGLAAAALPAPVRAQGIVLPEIEVVTTSPLQGPGVDRDKVPAMVQTVTADEFQRTHSLSVTETLLQRIPGVATTDTQGNSFVQDLQYRGFWRTIRNR